MRAELNAMAEMSLEEVTGLMEYLQSPKRSRTPEKQANAESRHARTANPEPPNPEPGTDRTREPNLNTNREP